MTNIFIGVDSREIIAFHVLAHSIMTRAAGPISITPLIQQSLRDANLYTRERGPTESTEFSLTRFLVPFLSGYKGVSIFLDCDMLCLVDITDLEFQIAVANNAFEGPQAKFLREKEEGKKEPIAVMVCKHDYVPKESTKFLGQQQTAYPRKNWSSLMVFANANCKMLTPDYVSKASGLDLHRFNWLKDEQIGSVPLEWNWLVGEYEKIDSPKMVHYTNGGPWFEDYKDCDYAQEWFAEAKALKVKEHSLVAF